MQFATDENFNGKILSGLLARIPDLDVIRIQDTDLYGEPDPNVLAWAAQENRILLTHDIQTLVPDAYTRVRDGEPMPGIIRVSTTISLGEALDDLAVIIGAGTPQDFENQVWHVPIR